MAAKEPKIRRPAVEPLENWVDMFIAGLGLHSYDLADPKTREKLRVYSANWMRRVLQSTLWDLQRGAERGMEQTLDCMLDPNHAENVKKRRRQLKETRVQKDLQVKKEAAIRESKKLRSIQ